MKSAFPDAVIGAGTVCSSDEYRRSVDAGADFVVSPGASEQLFAAAASHKVSFVPGAATGSEVIFALDKGYSTLKLFPAETSGGEPTIRALSGPFPQVRFMATGGVTLDNMGRYLNLSSVCAVGGLWLTPADLLAAQKWMICLSWHVIPCSARMRLMRRPTNECGRFDYFRCDRRFVSQKTVSALYQLDAAELLQEDLRIAAVGRQKQSVKAGMTCAKKWAIFAKPWMPYGSALLDVWIILPQISQNGSFMALSNWLMTDE